MNSLEYSTTNTNITYGQVGILGTTVEINVGKGGKFPYFNYKNYKSKVSKEKHVLPEGVNPRPPIRPAQRSDNISPYKFGITNTSYIVGS